MSSPNWCRPVRHCRHDTLLIYQFFWTNIWPILVQITYKNYFGPFDCLCMQQRPNYGFWALQEDLLLAKKCRKGHLLFPWYLSFHYILFNKKRLQTMLWHHYARVNSHQRWKQTRFRICFHLWCELTSTMNEQNDKFHGIHDIPRDPQFTVLRNPQSAPVHSDPANEKRSPLGNDTSLGNKGLSRHIISKIKRRKNRKKMKKYEAKIGW